MGKPVRMPELAELRAFCAAVDLGSIGRAARLLQVSQPALSKRLRALEALAGARLLERSSRGVSPTPAGTELYMAAGKVLAEAEAVEALMSGVPSDHTSVRLAASPTMAEFVLPRFLVDFEREHQRHLSVGLVIANSASARALVGEGRADLGVVAEDPSTDGPALVETSFCEDEVVVGVPEDHPWATADEVALDDFIRMPIIMRDPGANSRIVVDAALEALGLSLAPPLAEIGSTTAAKATAVSERVPVLLSLLALDALSEPLVVRRVAGLRFLRRFVLVHAGEESLTSPARPLYRFLREAAR
jgi:DNA-binding transcriptional LysR family regulator